MGGGGAGTIFKIHQHVNRFSIKLSYAAPLDKYQARVQEIVEGRAPSTVSIVRYNQRAVSVLSYVAQFACPDSSIDLAAKEHGAIHRILRMPPNSMTRDLMYNIDFCTLVSPTRLADYVLASMYRFALSEKSYLYKLAPEIHDICSDHFALTDLGGFVPIGGLDTPPILHSLLDALEFKGPHPRVPGCTPRAFESQTPGCPASSSQGPEGAPRPARTIPTSTSKLSGQPRAFQSETSRVNAVPIIGAQAAVLKALRPAISTRCLQAILFKKVGVTLGLEFLDRLRQFPLWLTEFQGILDGVKVYLRVCWLKTVAGAWTTTFRMHEDKLWQCIFGCQSCPDTLSHYLECPILWQIAGEAFPAEESIEVSQRVCILSPSVEKLQRLSVAHGVYHACKNDNICIVDGSPAHPRVVQACGAEFAKALRHLAS